MAEFLAISAMGTDLVYAGSLSALAATTPRPAVGLQHHGINSGLQAALSKLAALAKLA